MSYVCANCGYFENYIADQSKLADIASKWERVVFSG
jgi:predicted nucleic-acid-binding Zn-ribbon protein